MNLVEKKKICTYLGFDFNKSKFKKKENGYSIEYQNNKYYFLRNDIMKSIIIGER